MAYLKPLTISSIVCDKALSTMFPEKGKLIKISSNPNIYQRM